MRRYGITIVLFVLFLLEGTILEWIIPPVWQSTVLVVPHVVFVGVLLVGLFKNRYQALGYGLAFGMLQDFIYYGHALGVHSFSMGLVGYVAGLAFRAASRGVVISLIAAALGSFAYDSLVYGIYRFFLGVVRLDYQWTFLHQILPSMLFNALIALLLYMPARKWFEDDEASREPEEK
ncbi:rod shape-determining protein MreD [Paenibacillus flagellatus]|uniref:Rod shape-determining protein MreD n=1 Tax=Paenibacillus flagellatus TaxID=2211139 RepID=A0A2V5JZ74_9BACL|nr:rod shape-determining protein MreD [Paenibacillus flagellatus]PYI52249.1 rod shape-determining protein MreD [Paenibacillus flagellatus]